MQAPRVLLLARRAGRLQLTAAAATGAPGAAHRSFANVQLNTFEESQHIGLGVALPHLTRTGCIYLDYNATTPIYPEVAAEMAPFLFEHFGNPSSGHTYGKVCKAAVDTARVRVAELVGAAEPSEIHFTSCGTESDNWIIYGAVMAARRRQLLLAASGGPSPLPLPHVITSAVEHPAVLAHLGHLEEQGLLTYTAVPVDGEGLVDPAHVAAAVQPSTVLVTIMHSNNEVGAVQPIAAITAAARAAYVNGGGAAAGHLLIHTDAAQSAGKVELDVRRLGVNALTLVGHKLGAPKGVAALYIRRGVELSNYLHGGGQEGGRRAGTENVMQVVGLGAAAAVAVREGPALRAHLAATRERLLAAVVAGVAMEERSKLRLNGPSDPARRLPNTLSLSLRGLASSAALTRLGGQLAASAGAACHSGEAAVSVSGVLRAMQVPLEYAAGTLRLSTGRHTTAAEVDAAAGLVLGEARRQGVIS